MQCANIINVIISLTLALFYCAWCDAECQFLLSKGVSSNDANTIVNIHNNYRTEIATGRVKGQPKSSNMKRMKWDDKLASAAQKIAETCVFEHVKVQDSRFAVGQNLYWSGSTVADKTPDWNAAIKGWWDEHFTYIYGTTTYNHYTQVVWANSYLVGCGYTYYKNRQNGWYQKLYVCNYGPAGNYIGQTPYEEGNGCENLC